MPCKIQSHLSIQIYDNINAPLYFMHAHTTTYVHNVEHAGEIVVEIRTTHVLHTSPKYWPSVS